MGNELNIVVGVKANTQDIDVIVAQIDKRLEHIKVGFDLNTSAINKLTETLDKSFKVKVDADTSKAEIQLNKLKTTISNFQSTYQAKISNLGVSGMVSEQDLRALGDLSIKIDGLSTDTENANQKIKEYKQSYQELVAAIKAGKPVEGAGAFGIDVKSSEADLQRYVAALKGVEAEQVKVTSTTQKFSSAGNAIKVVNTEVQNSTGQWEKFRYTIDGATGDVRELATGMKNAGSAASASSSNFSDTIKQILGIGSAVMIAVKAIQMLTMAFDNMKKIDKQLTELSKVTNITRENFQQVSIEAIESANNYGKAADEYLAGAVAFARAGHENYQQLADVSVQAQAAGDITAELANQYLIATNAAFQLGGSEEKLLSILDGQNQVSKIALLCGNMWGCSWLYRESLKRFAIPRKGFL